MRSRTLFFVLAGLAMAITLTGCGSENATGVPPQPPSGSPGATTEPPAQTKTTVLSVAYKPSAKEPVKLWTLTCDPVGGTHPNAKPACAALDKAAATGKDPFAPPPKDHGCSMIYGGPQTSTVTGTWKGKKINAHFSRQDGCQIDRWGALAPLVGEIARPR
jgi:hypothetical protein